MPFHRTCLVALAAALGAVTAPTAANAADFALVNGFSGGLQGGSNAVSSARLSTGQYEILFNHDVTKCAYTATPGSSVVSFENPRATVVTARRTAKPNGVFVQTRAADGQPADSTFSLALACGKRQPAAVVAADGTLARGRHVVRADRLSAGSYRVVFDRDVRPCAWSATPGGTTNDVPPGRFATVAGSFFAVSGVVVVTTNASGVPEDQPFHLTVSCPGSPQHFAVTDLDGDLARGTGLLRHDQAGVGRYASFFGEGVRGCAAIATVGLSGAGTPPAPALMTTSPAVSDIGLEQGVFLATNDPFGTPSDRPTHLVVTC